MNALTADDFGLNKRVNQAIISQIKKHKLTHVSILVNQPATLEAFSFAQKYKSKISFGLHVNLCEGKPISYPKHVKSLVNSQGLFFSTPQFLLRLILGYINLSELEHEIVAQIHSYQSHKLPLKHLNTHQNLHIFPPLTQIFLNLSQKHHIPQLRQTSTVLSRLCAFPLKYLITKTFIFFCHLKYPDTPSQITNNFKELTSHPGTIYDDPRNLRNHLN